MDNTKTKIKELFANLEQERKDNVRTILSNEFKISIDSVKNNWIYGGNIPPQNIDRVIEVLKIELKLQSDDILELIDTI